MTVVVHHDVVPWPFGTDLLAISGTGGASAGQTDDESHPVPARHLLNLPFLLDDLATQSTASLHARDMAPLARLGLLCLKRARHSGDLLAELRPWLDVLRLIPWTAGSRVAQLGLLRYIIQVTDMPYAALSRFLRVEVGPEAENMMKTTYERILEQGKAEGKAEGKVEGRVEGEVQGMATLLLGLLEARFGTISAPVVKMVRGAAPAQLERWATRVLTEATLDRVLGLD
jgi:hypothetical protein